GVYISQVGRSGKGAGRKAMLYEINKDSGCLLVLYYRWGKYVGRVADMTGTTLHEASFPLDNGNIDTALDCTMKAIDSLANVAANEVKAIGVGVPGAVLPDGRLLGIPKIAVWEGLNLAEKLEARYPVNVCVENDVKLSAVGYYRTHLSDSCDNMAYIYAGNGLGAGIIINKRLYRGSTNFSGELGFMAPLTDKQPKRDYTGVGGYLESQLSGYINTAQGEFWAKDDPKHRKVLTNILGAAAANHVALLNPNVIVFGGEAFDTALIRDIHAQLAFYVLRESMPRILHDSGDTTGIEGLILACLGFITPHVRLVQNAGV
ncbi:MAG: ROK family protein, partial [Clostridia bacterium]|nr:ROK family protein [Clostridia bacterium]